MGKQRKRGKWSFPVRARHAPGRPAQAHRPPLDAEEMLARIKEIDIILQRAKALYKERDGLLSHVIAAGIDVAPFGGVMVDNYIDAATGEFKNLQWKKVAMSRYTIKWVR